MQFRVVTEIIDLETGEIISKSKYERENYYTVSNRKVKTEIKNNIHITYYEKSTRPNRQTKFEF